MEEEQTQTEQSEQPQAADPVQDPLNLVDSANKAAERLEQANDRFEKLLQKEAAAQAERVLSGRSTTVPTKPVTQEDQEIHNVREFLKGSGYDDELFPLNDAV